MVIMRTSHVCAHAGICMVESWRNANLIVKWETETRKDKKQKSMSYS